ncbi:MAG: hypothetical protein CSA49_04810 [Gammaproteobacteria bacterium]|nr:MAG: hypothetical protein CSA49_04810 [Gammaproteobacteria bacterium]
MEIINDTPFTFGLLPGRIYFPHHSLTLIVKGTFDLQHLTAPQLAEEQTFPEGDVFYEGDDEGKGSVFYESDFAYAKTATDCFLVGHCQGAEAARVRRVDFKIGNFLKSVAVFGDRSWLGGYTISQPEYFDTLALRYENALGGPGYTDNPVGKGIAKGSVLPNIEYPDQLMQSPQSRPPMACTGAVNRNWTPRRLKIGTYTHNYVKERWPWFAEDFDWSYFNSAPADQQVKPCLTGDEPLVVTSMHPQHDVFETHLPGLRARIFVSTANEPTLQQFTEVKSQLDTVWVNMDDQTLRLVWRGWLQVSSDEYPEIKHCFVFAEPTTIVTPDHVVFERFQECWLELQYDEEPEEPEEPAADKLTSEEINAQLEKEIAEARQSMRAHLISLGVDPKELDDAMEKAIAEEEKREAEKPKPKVWTRELFKLALEKRRNFSQEDLTAVDFSGLNLQGVDFKQADLTQASFYRCKLTNCDFSQAILEKASFVESYSIESLFVGADLFQADFSHARLNSTNLSDCLADEACFDNSMAQNLVMQQASANKASFRHMTAPSADFTATDFSYSDLSAVDWHQSQLSQASIEGCVAKAVNFMLADLTELRASEGLDAEGSNFCQVVAPASIWEQANLKNCNFTYAKMQGATLNKAQLQGADVSAADFKLGKFAGADLATTKAVMINLFEGSFEKANLTRADLRGSNLYGVEFLEANIEQTLFEAANLHGTKLKAKMREGER